HGVEVRVGIAVVPGPYDGQHQQLEKVLVNENGDRLTESGRTCERAFAVPGQEDGRDVRRATLCTEVPAMEDVEPFVACPLIQCANNSREIRAAGRSGPAVSPHRSLESRKGAGRIAVTEDRLSGLLPERALQECREQFRDLTERRDGSGAAMVRRHGRRADAERAPAWRRRPVLLSAEPLEAG